MLNLNFILRNFCTFEAEITILSLRAETEMKNGVGIKKCVIPIMQLHTTTSPM